MDKHRARQVLEQFAEREADLSMLAETKHIDFNTNLFGLQRDIINDTGKRKACLAGRRAGKTMVAIYYMIKVAYETPKTDVAYIALSKTSAKRIIWSELLYIMDRYKLDYKTNGTELIITFSNGSTINVSGANDDRTIDRHRGAKYALVVVDECGATQMLSLLDNLIESVIGPTLFDKDGTLLLISTPGLINAGIFYDITTGLKSRWRVWKWNLFDNPLIDRWAGNPNYKDLVPTLLAEIREENNWEEDSPTYVREYLGKWVIDDEVMIYPFSANNIYKNLPDMSFNYIFGVDLGVVDASTIIVGAYSSETPNLYLVDEFKQTGMAPSDFAETLKRYYDRYTPTMIVADTGGLGKAYVQEVEKRFVLPMEPAEKTDKLGMVTLMADDFRLGRIKVHYSLEELKRELYLYQWKNVNLKLLPDADEHLLDSLLYAWRKSIHFIGKIKPHNPRRVEDELYESALNKIENPIEWWDE